MAYGLIRKILFSRLGLYFVQISFYRGRRASFFLVVPSFGDSIDERSPPIEWWWCNNFFFLFSASCYFQLEAKVVRGVHTHTSSMINKAKSLRSSCFWGRTRTSTNKKRRSRRRTHSLLLFSDLKECELNWTKQTGQGDGVDVRRGVYSFSSSFKGKKDKCKS